jgi:hypothetical protein
LAQDFQVVADGWLGDAERFDEVAYPAGFAGGEGFIEKRDAAFNDGVHRLILLHNWPG